MPNPNLNRRWLRPTDVAMPYSGETDIRYRVKFIEQTTANALQAAINLALATSIILDEDANVFLDSIQHEIFVLDSGPQPRERYTALITYGIVGGAPIP